MPGHGAMPEPPAVRSSPGVLESLRKSALLLIAAFVIFAILGYVVSLYLPTRYTTQAAVFFRADAQFQPAEVNNGSADPIRFAADQAELVLTTEVLQRAGAAVNPPLPVDQVRDSVSAAPSSTTSRMTVTVVRPDPKQAKALADAVVDSYRLSARDRVNGVEAGALNSVQDPGSAQDIRLRSAAYGDGVAAVEPAVVPLTASAPLRGQNALLGGLAGLLLTAGAVVLRDQRRARRATLAELDMLLGAPLLARFPAPTSSLMADMVTTDPDSPRLRSAHDVLMALDVALDGPDKASSILFLSWQRAMATTSLVVSVAVTASQSGRSVVAIDGGLKQRGITALSALDPGIGLEALADRRHPLSASLRRWDMDESTAIDVVPLNEWAPTRNGSAARPQVLRRATERLGEDISLSLIDGPPLTERSLGLALGRGVQGVVLVIDEETSLNDAHEMGRRVDLAGVGVIGYVLIGTSSRWSAVRNRIPVRHREKSLSLDAHERPSWA